MIHTLILLCAVIAIAGVLLWGIQNLKIDDTLKQLFRVAIIVIVSIYVILKIVALAGVAI